jgi:hypothetical protein
VIEFYKQSIELINQEKKIFETEQEVFKKANQRANLNIFFKGDFSNYEKIDVDSVMYIDFPKSWVSDPVNYSPKLNY